MNEIKGRFQDVSNEPHLREGNERVYLYRNIKTHIFASSSDIKHVFSPVGSLTKFSGVYVGEIRTGILEQNIRGDSFEEVASRIDVEIDFAIEFESKINDKLPTRINKAIIKILTENQSLNDEKHILRIMNAEGSQQFFIDFERGFEANNENLEEVQKNQLIYYSVQAIINKHTKFLTPTEKRKLRDKEFINSKNLCVALVRGVSNPNLCDLLSYVIRSPDIEPKRREKLIDLSNYMLNGNFLKVLPSLEESLECFMRALGNREHQSQEEYDKAYPLNEAIGTNYLEDGQDLKAFETTQPHKRYDRQLLNICEEVAGGLPESLCDFYEVIYGKDCWESARRDYIRWKDKSEVKEDRKKILSRLSPNIKSLED